MNLIIQLFIILNINVSNGILFWPVDLGPGKEIQLTEIGAFGLKRPVRPGIAAHLHTGIDIKRPSDNFIDEFVYPIARGKVISKRDDGPYAQLIIQHNMNDLTFWTLYEHIAGIMVSAGDSLYPNIPMARFMNREELNRYGWQFNHIHLEILKTAPDVQKPAAKNPEGYYKSKTLTIYSQNDLQKHFYNPVDFINRFIH